jgi:flagellar biosynthesis protein FlhA
VLTIKPELEQIIVESAVDVAGSRICALKPDIQIEWIRAIAKQVMMIKEQGWLPPIILCSEQARILVKQSTEREIPELVVLSVREIVQDVNVVPVGEIRFE